MYTSFGSNLGFGRSQYVGSSRVGSFSNSFNTFGGGSFGSGFSSIGRGFNSFGGFGTSTNFPLNNFTNSSLGYGSQTFGSYQPFATLSLPSNRPGQFGVFSSTVAQPITPIVTTPTLPAVTTPIVTTPAVTTPGPTGVIPNSVVNAPTIPGQDGSPLLKLIVDKLCLNGNYIGHVDYGHHADINPDPNLAIGIQMKVQSDYKKNWIEFHKLTEFKKPVTFEGGIQFGTPDGEGGTLPKITDPSGNPIISQGKDGSLAFHTKCTFLGRGKDCTNIYDACLDGKISFCA